MEVILQGRIHEVNAAFEALITIRLQDLAGRIHEFEAILDTGFNGSLTLPPAIVSQMQLPWRTRGSAELADGSEKTFDIYSANIICDDKPRSILVSFVETKPLLGMHLLADHDLRIRVQSGGAVEIVQLPKSSS